MNLPLIIDIAIGLIFIYLILSLFTSELQELLTTLLQWRAVHLKESIEGLLAGSNTSEQLRKSRQLANRLYNNPLIRTLNQEAKGRFLVFTRIANGWYYLFRVFGQDDEGNIKTSGPSYIPSQAFAVSLMDTLGIPQIASLISLLRLKSFVVGQILTQVGNDKLRQRLQSRFESILNSYQQQQTDLATTVSRIVEACDRYANLAELSDREQLALQLAELNTTEDLDLTVQDILQFRALREGVFGLPDSPTETAVIVRYLQPTLIDLVNLIREHANVDRFWQRYKNIRDEVAQRILYTEVLSAIRRFISEVSASSQMTDEQRSAVLKDILAVETRMDEFLRHPPISLVDVPYRNLLDQAIAPIRANLNRPEWGDWIVDEIMKRLNIHQIDLERVNHERAELKNYIDSLVDILPAMRQDFLVFANLLAQQGGAEVESLWNLLVTRLAPLEQSGELNQYLKDMLTILAEQAHLKAASIRAELTQFQQELENWFDQAIARAAGVYKRNTKLVAICLGIIAAIAVNADTIHIVTRLAADSALRDDVVTIATEAAKAEITGPTSDGGANQGPNPNRECLALPRSEAEKQENCQQFFAILENAAQEVALPIGWGDNNRLRQRQEAQQGLWQNIWPARYALGWLITGIALSMGASFWYDLLGRFISVRNTGKKPETPPAPSTSTKV
ncbi:hypothetical protein OOK60_15845 [Trichothermofontia sichuanensis B231]|uniref:hypothetical protein n=1 Tax=Trichothermofontia sichuanensis TaxID=3045816 RepID=UPI002245E377|nr:hypothetical protein [Trichothermofontia sichuanensis]UZQ53944.1 hypothetical protein OOK60_15845 [Trichothermofontia sichuanensis B231]